tara:strand:+ start:1389 stop:1589 length:201 start_codon:yes stop_codon:yes gene_type:complete
MEIFKNENSNIIVSIILGLGLATLLFTYKCKTNCIIYKLKDDVNINNIHEYNNKCYKFKKETVECK